jgi:SAM-dependent methyltransferase
MSNETEIKFVKNIYDEIASEFKVTRVNKWSWVTSFITQLPKNSLIYDIGCGNGRNMKYDNYNFIGIDNCNNFLDICNNDGLKTVYGEMTEIPLENNSADAIINIASFHHLSTTDNRLKALKEFKRLLKPQGKILLSVWSINQPSKTRVTFNSYGNNTVYWKKKHPRYYYIFKIDELYDLFYEAGLTVISHDYDCGNEVFILH